MVSWGVWFRRLRCLGFTVVNLLVLICLLGFGLAGFWSLVDLMFWVWALIWVCWFGGLQGGFVGFLCSGLRCGVDLL